jgi:lactate racemase
MNREFAIPYGKQALNIHIPEPHQVKLFSPGHVDPCPDPLRAIEDSLSNPLDVPTIQETVKLTDEVVILVDDHTRITPISIILPALLNRLHRVGVKDKKITILISNGTHRKSTEEELKRKLGDAICNRYSIAQHDCKDSKNQVFCGLTDRGTPVWVNRKVVETDRLFGIGHIDPSTFAGYAGGYKLIVPGVASLETIDANHSMVPLGFRRHVDLEVPVRKDIENAGSLIRADLFINVVLCQDGQIAKVFAGSPQAVFRAGVPLARQVYEVPYTEKLDIAVTSGFPYDIDFYQAIRSIQYSDNAVKPGGSIVMVAPCKDGVGSKEFFDLLSSNVSAPDDYLRNVVRRTGKVTNNVLCYFLSLIRAEKKIYVVSDGISAEDLTAVGLIPISDLQNGVNELLKQYGAGAQVGIFPMGSACVPVYRSAH